MKTNEAKSESDEARCWVVNSQTQVLRAELEDGSCHLCPYAWLVWVQYSPKDETDRLDLTFNSHIVSITGRNLRELALAFQRMNVESIKVLPQRRKFLSDDKMSFIGNILVELRENDLQSPKNV